MTLEIPFKNALNGDYYTHQGKVEMKASGNMISDDPRNTRKNSPKWRLHPLSIKSIRKRMTSGNP